MLLRGELLSRGRIRGGGTVWREPELLAPAVLRDVVHLPARGSRRRRGHVMCIVVLKQQVPVSMTMVVCRLGAAPGTASVPAARGRRHGDHHPHVRTRGSESTWLAGLSLLALESGESGGGGETAPHFPSAPGLWLAALALVSLSVSAAVALPCLLLLLFPRRPSPFIFFSLCFFPFLL